MRSISIDLETWEPSQRSFIDTGKPRKTCVEVAGKCAYIWRPRLASCDFFICCGMYSSLERIGTDNSS